MSVLHLVRHGRPIVGDSRRTDWPLDPEHVVEVDRLGGSGALPDEARWFTSPELKARATAQRLGHAEAVVVPDLHEQDRPEGFIDDFESVIKRSITHPLEQSLPGWESARSTGDRVGAAIKDILDDAAPVVLVGHGFAWTVLVAQLTGTEPDVETWRSMRMPDHCAIENDRVVSSWGQWATAR